MMDSRLAWRLRANQVEALLLGRGGPLRAIALWGGFFLLLSLAALLGGPLLLAAILAFLLLVVVMARAGSPSHWSHWLMVVSMMLWLGGFAYAWWVLGVNVDAADQLQEPPAYASFGGLALTLSLLGFLGFCASVAVAVARTRRRPELPRSGGTP